jgi:dephospho-CoA kinase
MIVAGLTGSIAMGKTTTARLFADRGIPVFDSDAAVHALYEKGGKAVPALLAVAPETIVDGAVDRKLLAAEILLRPDLLEEIEKSVHPLVEAMQQAFIEDAANAGANLVILDIPLLFETARDRQVDKTIVVTATPELQRERALQRPGMTKTKFDFILSRQVPDVEKRARADFVIDTSTGFADAARQVDHVISELAEGGCKQ